MFSDKQKEMLCLADRRWNIYEGAVRSGKTFGSYFKIVSRLDELSGLTGDIAFIGRSFGTLERNLLEPMRQLGFPISKVTNKGSFTIFGQQAYLFGAYNRQAADSLRGMKLKYAYGDEVATWDPKVFDMLKSRLDCGYSKFDGTCNPEGPNHWLKKFIDSGADVYDISFCIDDNPYLSERFIAEIKKEYAGTVYYDRYILGKWVMAEGIIYRAFADRPETFLLRNAEAKAIKVATIGVDFGGNKSATHFTCTGFTTRFEKCIILDEEHRAGIRDDPQSLERAFVNFCKKQVKSGYPLQYVLADSAEQTLIRGLQRALLAEGFTIKVENALKRPINERIALVTRLMGSGRFFILGHCVHTINAFSTALYDEKKDKDTRLDDGTTDIDSLDAAEYSIEPFMKYLIKAG